MGAAKIIEKERLLPGQVEKDEDQEFQNTKPGESVSRLFYIFIHLPIFLGFPATIFRPVEGGYQVIARGH